MAHHPAVLYHGTSMRNARQILREGFRRPKDASYTGTAICLSESMTVSYEYGEYEHNGCVLAVTFRPDVNLSAGNPDAESTYGGNVWLLWNVNAIATINPISHAEAVSILLDEFQDDGSNCAYNGVAGDYAELYWDDISEHSALRDIKYRKQLESHLAKARLIQQMKKGGSTCAMKSLKQLVPCP